MHVVGPAVHHPRIPDASEICSGIGLRGDGPSRGGGAVGEVSRSNRWLASGPRASSSLAHSGAEQTRLLKLDW